MIVGSKFKLGCGRDGALIFEADGLCASLADSSLGELEDKCPLIEILLWLFYLDGRKCAFSFQIKDQLMSLGLLIAILDNG